jgi:hypothetical protein
MQASANLKGLHSWPMHSQPTARGINALTAEHNKHVMQADLTSANPLALSIVSQIGNVFTTDVTNMSCGHN